MKDIKLNLNLIIKDEDIDCIMKEALDTGIWYWCERVSIASVCKEWNDYQQISKNGILLLKTKNGIFFLDKEDFIKGIRKAIYDDYNLLNIVDGKLYIDTFYIDADIADRIVQYAVFDKIIYG